MTTQIMFYSSSNRQPRLNFRLTQYNVKCFGSQSYGPERWKTRNFKLQERVHIMSAIEVINMWLISTH